MSAIPSAREIIRSDGLSVIDPVTQVPVVIGASSSGTVNAVAAYSSVQTLVDEQAQGPGVEEVAHILSNSGGPVVFVKIATTVAASNGTVTTVGTGPACTFAGAATIDTRLRVVIVTGGANGTATFKYCCDDAPGITDDSLRTYSETLTVPAGGTFVVPNLGITITFPVGTHVANTTHSVDVQCAGWNSTDLAAAFTALMSSVHADSWRFAYPVTSRACGDETAHALLVTALQTQLNSLASVSRHRRGIIAAEQGGSPTAVATALASVTGERVLVAFGQTRRATTKPFPGFAYPTLHAAGCFAQRAASSLISTDLKRVKSGPLAALASITRDEDKAPTGLDNIRVSTLRTWQGKSGFYVTQGRLKSAAGSSFDSWPLGIIMDVAAEAAHAVMVDVVGSSVRTNSGDEEDKPAGTIYETDASDIEVEAKNRLNPLLLQETNAEGSPGHVSDYRFQVDRTVSILTTKTIRYRVAFLPRGYADYIVGDFGYTPKL